MLTVYGYLLYWPILWIYKKNLDVVLHLWLVIEFKEQKDLEKWQQYFIT